MTAASASDYVNLAGTLLSTAATAKSAFTPTPKAPKVDLPASPKSVDMPTTDDEAVKKARIRAIEQRQASSGRQSTILRSDETLG